MYVLAIYCLLNTYSTYTVQFSFESELLRIRATYNYLFIGDRNGSFQTVNFDLFKPEKEKLLVFKFEC